MKRWVGLFLGMVLLHSGAGGADPPLLTTSPVPPGWHVVDPAEGSIAPDSPGPLPQELQKRGIRLIAVRHGQSQANARALKEGRRVLCGQVESPLSPQGREQAREAAAKLYAMLGGDAWLLRAAADPSQLPLIYSSPLSRAQDTAGAAVDFIQARAQALELRSQAVMPALRIRVDPRLTEYGFGDCELRPVPEVCRELPEFMRNWDPIEGSGVDFLHRFPHGESRADVLVRVHSFLVDLASQTRERTVLVFCHMRTIAAAQEDLGQMPIEKGRVREYTGNLSNATPLILAPGTPGDH